MIFTREGKDLWSTANKIIFRFIFSYCCLYMLSVFASTFWNPIIQWIGSDLLEIDYTFTSSGRGSGDTTYQYVVVLFVFVISIITTIIWSLIDRKRKSYNDLFYWFRLTIRIFLIFFMLTYGFAKVFKSQFPYPYLTRLLQPLGDMSPMRLAWTFMGYSFLYNIFTGLAEIIGGLLLISKRTKTLGAFISIGVMLNVLFMNLSYDIPVKIFSFHLILLASVIFFSDFNRFFKAFFKNETVQKVTVYKPFKIDKDVKKVFNGLKLLFIISLVGLFSFLGYSRVKTNGESREKPYLYGIWEVSTFKKNNETLPPLITDTKRWRYLIIDFKGRAVVKTMDGVNHSYNFKPDSIVKKISIHKEKEDTYNFIYKNPNALFLQLDGKIDEDSLHIILSKKDLNDFKLNSRGFNWINEYPYNR